MNPRHRRQLTMFGEFGGSALVVLALLITLSEVGLHILATLNGRRYTVSWIMLFIALVMGFVGMFILSPMRAKDGGKFLVDNTIRVLQVFRIGRRKDDSLAVVLEDSMGNTAELAVPSLSTADDKHYDDHVGRRSTDVKVHELELPPPEKADNDRD